MKIVKLLRLADSLDSKGLYKEADELAEVMKEFADTDKEILSAFDQGMSLEDISKKYEIPLIYVLELLESKTAFDDDEGNIVDFYALASDPSTPGPVLAAIAKLGYALTDIAANLSTPYETLRMLAQLAYSGRFDVLAHGTESPSGAGISRVDILNELSRRIREHPGRSSWQLDKEFPYLKRFNGTLR